MRTAAQTEADRLIAISAAAGATAATAEYSAELEAALEDRCDESERTSGGGAIAYVASGVDCNGREWRVELVA